MTLQSVLPKEGMSMNREANITDKALLMIGMARRANKVYTGSDKCTEAVRSKRAKLIIIATDASDNTRKMLINACTHYSVQYIEYGTMADLGHITSSPITATVAVIDDNFAKAILDRAIQA